MPRQPKDIVSRETRSRMMRSVRRKGTAPELAVRQILRGLGARYRLNHPGLPGRPDIANRSRGWAIFVHGCFWHGHRNCRVLKSGKRERVPARNADFWGSKLEANRKRDARKSRELEAIGIDVLVIWECELRDVDAVRETVRTFLETKGVMPSP